MGHTEMGFAVAGLSDEEVGGITRRLAGDWSDFSASEQAAFAFTRKQAENPASITGRDLGQLAKHYGVERAWQIVWWSARSHYMTKVADAFQFPLELENPFWSMPGAAPRK